MWARMSFPKFPSSAQLRGLGHKDPPLHPPLPEPLTVDRSRQVLREEEKEEMSLWERPRGPGKDQAGGGVASALPGLSAIAVGELRGREERRGGKEEAKEEKGKVCRRRAAPRLRPPHWSGAAPLGQRRGPPVCPRRNFGFAAGRTRRVLCVRAHLHPPHAGVLHVPRSRHFGKKKRASVTKSRATATTAHVPCNRVPSLRPRPAPRRTGRLHKALHPAAEREGDETNLLSYPHPTPLRSFLKFGLFKASFTTA